MEERASGIILRTRPLTETSLIVEWLTRDLGRITTVAKGARRPKSPFLGKLDLFYEAEFSFVPARRSHLHTLREISVRNANPALRQDIQRLNEAAYFTVLLEKSTESEAPIPELHDLLKQALAHLGTDSACPRVVFVFELKLLCALGYAPVLDPLKDAVRTRTEKAMTDSFEQSVAELSLLDSSSLRELNNFLQKAVGTALERVPIQRAAALKGA